MFSIMRCTCPGQYFGWKFYLEKMVSYFVSDLEWQNFGLLDQFSLACFHWRSFYVSKNLERRQQNKEKLRFYTFFGVFERKVYALWPKSLRQCFQNCVIPSQGKVLEENVFKKFYFHAFTRSLSGKVSYFEWKLFACFSKLHPTFIEAFK